MSKLPFAAIGLAAGLTAAAAVAEPRQNLNACLPSADAATAAHIDADAHATMRGMCEWAASAPSNAGTVQARASESRDLLGELDASRRAAMPEHPWQSEDLTAAIESINIRELLADIERRRLDIWPDDVLWADDRTANAGHGQAREG